MAHITAQRRSAVVRLLCRCTARTRHWRSVRTGHHCAQPILRRFGVERTVRPSLSFYNTTEEIDLLVSVLHQLRRAKPLKASRH